MQEKLFKTALATYLKAQWNGENKSGWRVIGDKVLIKPDTCSDTSTGGIALPDDVVERMTMASEAGVVVSVGDGAFQYDSNGATPFVGTKPAPGDRVSIGRYSGQLIRGHDGDNYRILNSSEIGAIEVQ